MPWRSLGIVEVGENWRDFPNFAVDCETFRVIHRTVVDPINSCFLTRYFPLPEPGGRLTPWRRIYPSAEPQILNLPMPRDYREQGIFVFHFEVKWRFPYYPVQWLIEIEALE